MTRWVERTAIDWPLVSLRWTWVFETDGATLTSESTLRFRTREEVVADLHDTGYDSVEVRDPAGRPAAEFVVLARPSSSRSASPTESAAPSHEGG